VVPKDLVFGNANYRPEMEGLDVSHGTYVHICGIDLVRDEQGRFMVLEDNGRTPSGVSYVVENRQLMQRTFPELLADIGIRPVEDYGLRLQEAMLEIAPPGIDAPQVVDDDRVYMKTTAGPARVDVIYRRLNDDFLDPEAFRPETMLGVPGIMRAYRKGNVALANAVGTGVADDKAIYAYLPRVIMYYLDEEPILPNVETRICREPDALAYTLDHLDELVVKPVGESGGYGITVGPRASTAELEACRTALTADPETYISQPMVNLSVAPTLVEAGVQPRHVDLRPFAVTGEKTWVLPGGLSRVALREGSIVVNSSQGGGSKDTWVLE
jgi:uncharacterized circularly permuted ATP-grasp superfamily protein